MSRVERAFQEYRDRRDGLIKALSTNLDTLVMEAKKVEEHTPYGERKCLWGLLGKEWELKHATFPTIGEPPHPQPLPQLDAVASHAEWSNLVCDYSDAWLVEFMAYKLDSFSREERMELMENVHDLPSLKDVIYHW